MNSEAVTAFKDLVLQKLRLHARVSAAPYVLRNAEANAEMDYVTDRLVLSLDSHVLGEAKERTHTIVEQPVWPSWKHQLVASLPERSFRRLFLEIWWDLLEADGQTKPLATRVTHTVTAHAYRAFPENTQTYPKELGQYVVFATIDDYSEKEWYR